LSVITSVHLLLGGKSRSTVYQDTSPLNLKDTEIQIQIFLSSPLTQLTISIMYTIYILILLLKILGSVRLLMFLKDISYAHLSAKMEALDPSRAEILRYL